MTFVDVETIGPGETKLVWEKREYVPPKEGTSHALALVENDCKTRMRGLRSLTKYATDGSVLYAHTVKTPEMDYVAPETTAESILNFVCRYDHKAAVKDPSLALSAKGSATDTREYAKRVLSQDQ